MCKLIHNEGRKSGLPHLVACLMGRFKSEIGEHCVVLPFGSDPASGIKFGGLKS